MQSYNYSFVRQRSFSPLHKYDNFIIRRERESRINWDYELLFDRHIYSASVNVCVVYSENQYGWIIGHQGRNIPEYFTEVKIETFHG